MCCTTQAGVGYQQPHTVFANLKPTAPLGMLPTNPLLPLPCLPCRCAHVSTNNSEADRLEEAEGGENANGDMGLPGMADDAAGGGGEGKAQAICVINAQGIIQMANKVLWTVVGRAGLWG